MASTSSGKVFEKAACKYCSAEISTNALARHEADCMNATPELREKRKAARDSADRKRFGNPADRGKQRTAECAFCHDRIGVGSLERHQVKCETQSPTQREEAKAARAYQAKFYSKKNAMAREKYRESVRIPTRTTTLDEPVVPDRRHTGQLSSNGKPMAKPMSVTMLVDEDNLALALGRVVIQKLPELLPQLIPGLSIEAFATKSHRAGKV